MKKIPVKIGWEMVIPLNILFLWILYNTNGESWEGVAIMGTTCLVINYSFFSMQYSLDSEFLYIKAGMFGTKKIKIDEIKKIEKTWNLIASPAPSIYGRVEIYYGNKSIVISPKNFDEFKTELLKINKNITVKE